MRARKTGRFALSVLVRTFTGKLPTFASCWGLRNVGRTPTPCNAYLVRFAFTLVEGHQMKTPEPSKENPSAPDTRKFTGTDNPRHLRVIPALMTRPRRREDIDDIAGCSNGPDLIAALRDMGLEVPCNRVKFLDRDGNTLSLIHISEPTRPY